MVDGQFGAERMALLGGRGEMVDAHNGLGGHACQGPGVGRKGDW